MIYTPRVNEVGQWRIIRLENGGELNICGAVSMPVAYDQCTILNTRLIELIRAKSTKLDGESTN